jgi:adenylate kinase family enzyme
MKKPVIVYVSGAPGSGKTTLAKILSEQLYIPSISSDLIHGGVALQDPGHSRKNTLKNVFVQTLIDMADKGVSIVVDHVLQKDLSEKDIIEKIQPHATLIYIHTQTTHPIERYIERLRESTLPSIVERREHLLDLALLHMRNLEKTNIPLELGVPTLIVNTDHDYDPTIEKIVEFIHKNK